MAEKETIAEAVSWYSKERPVYHKLSKKVESIIEEIINDQNVAIHAIYSRAKDIDSFAKKLEDPKYTNPKTDITDLAGIRVISYVESDLENISKLIEANFDIDKENSIDKSETLGEDKVGYRSIHFIAKLPNDRLKLPEYKKYSGIFFEIQIRTILQHAWAEIEHDKNYKFSGVLPIKLKRRFKILAGLLELADREFNEIASEIDKYSASVKADTKKGKLDIPIDSTSIKLYLKEKFKDLIKQGMNPEFASENSEKLVLDELREFKITTLKELDNIIPIDYCDRAIKYRQSEVNYTGLVRHLMIVNDADKYFRDSWKNHWKNFNSNVMEILRSYNPKIEEVFKNHNIKTIQ
jgi:putative GTP pyrophosphokinase